MMFRLFFVDVTKSEGAIMSSNSIVPISLIQQYLRNGWYPILRSALFNSITKGGEQTALEFFVNGNAELAKNIFRVLAELDLRSKYGVHLKPFRVEEGKWIIPDAEAILWWRNNGFKGIEPEIFSSQIHENRSELVVA
jgi:hypothetical protein